MYGQLVFSKPKYHVGYHSDPKFLFLGLDKFFFKKWNTILVLLIVISMRQNFCQYFKCIECNCFNLFYEQDKSWTQSTAF